MCAGVPLRSWGEEGSRNSLSVQITWSLVSLNQPLGLSLQDTTMTCEKNNARDKGIIWHILSGIWHWERCAGSLRRLCETMICSFFLVSGFFNAENCHMKYIIFEESILGLPEVSLGQLSGLIWPWLGGLVSWSFISCTKVRACRFDPQSGRICKATDRRFSPQCFSLNKAIAHLNPCVWNNTGKMPLTPTILQLASEECYFSLQKQDPLRLPHQSLAAFWAKRTANREQRELWSLLWAPPHSFLSVTRLVLGSRCSAWMSDAAGRCFPLNPLSLSICL